MAKEKHPKRKKKKITEADRREHTGISGQTAFVDSGIKAKPKGWRIVGSEPETYRRPSEKEIRQGYAMIDGEKRKVYQESRRNRSDLRDRTKYRYL